MNQVLSTIWELGGDGRSVLVPVPGAGKLEFRVEGDGAQGDVEDVLRAVAAVPKLLRACKDALSTPPGMEPFRWKKTALQLAVAAAGYHGERECHLCGCTDEDCRGCVEETGIKCDWVAENLCSACAQKGLRVARVFRDDALRAGLGRMRHGASGVSGGQAGEKRTWRSEGER